ncbi:MAG TPA: enoyl-CoA hydratase/isomerase family protein [Pyrinomonadaceae bacterium]|nr:enoyl-CoA hydratase/isomerase family protein [Pyrinomonadaceae bacterium]
MTDEATPAVVVETRYPVAVVRLNRPARRNPLSAAVLEELETIVAELCAREDVCAVVFTGSGEAFASGADIREVGALAPESALEFARRGQRLMNLIDDAPLLTVAAVNGYCMGGALDLALACDLRVASPSAVFAHPGARLGIVTGWGGTQRLPRLVGSARAFEMLLTGRRLTAREAYDAGLVDRLADPPLERALELAGEWSKKKCRR